MVEEPPPYALSFLQYVACSENAVIRFRCSELELHRVNLHIKSRWNLGSRKQTADRFVKFLLCH